MAGMAKATGIWRLGRIGSCIPGRAGRASRGAFRNLHLLDQIVDFQKSIAINPRDYNALLGLQALNVGRAIDAYAAVK